MATAKKGTVLVRLSVVEAGILAGALRSFRLQGTVSEIEPVIAVVRTLQMKIAQAFPPKEGSS
jgi:hypothetical protein